MNQLTSANGGARIHDADGNLIDDGTKLFVWDAENRLIEIKLKSDDSTVATYAYDYQSRRITKTVGSTVTNFVYDGWNPIAEYTSALSPLSFTLSTSYTWGMDLSGAMQGAGGVGGLLSLNDGSATYYPIYDGNGNVSEYVDATGAVVAHYEYDAFGQVVASGSKKDDFTHQFSTKQLDSESGFHYYGYRYYDSLDGRWLNRDFIKEIGGLNIYGFVGNDSSNRVDLLGLTNDTVEVIWGHNYDLQGYLEKNVGNDTPRCFSGCSSNFLNGRASFPSDQHYTNNSPRGPSSTFPGAGPNDWLEEDQVIDSVTAEINAAKFEAKGMCDVPTICDTYVKVKCVSDPDEKKDGRFLVDQETRNFLHKTCGKTYSYDCEDDVWE